MSKNEKYLNEWIKKISKRNSILSIKRRIIRHSKEIYKKDAVDWSASMRNMIDIFDRMHKIKPDIKLRLEKLNKKYRKNLRRYTSPPKWKLSIVKKFRE